MNTPFKPQSINWKLQTLIQIRTSMFVALGPSLQQEIIASKALLFPPIPKVEAVAPPVVVEVAPAPAAPIQAEHIAITASEPILEAKAEPKETIEVKNTEAITEAVAEAAPVESKRTFVPEPSSQPKKSKLDKQDEESDDEKRERLSLDALIARIEKFKKKVADQNAELAANPVDVSVEKEKKKPSKGEPLVEEVAAPVEVNTPLVAEAAAPMAEAANHVEIADAVSQMIERTESLNRFVPLDVARDASKPKIGGAERDVAKDRMLDAISKDESLAPAGAESMKRFVMPDFGAVDPTPFPKLRNDTIEASETTTPTAEAIAHDDANEYKLGAGEVLISPSMQRFVLPEFVGEEPSSFPKFQKHTEFQAPAEEATVIASSEDMGRFVTPSFGETKPEVAGTHDAPAEPAVSVIVATEDMSRFVAPAFGDSKPEVVGTHEAEPEAPATETPSIEAKRADMPKPDAPIAFGSIRRFVMPEFGQNVVHSANLMDGPTAIPAKRTETPKEEAPAPTEQVATETTSIAAEVSTVTEPSVETAEVITAEATPETVVESTTEEKAATELEAEPAYEVAAEAAMAEAAEAEQPAETPEEAEKPAKTVISGGLSEMKLSQVSLKLEYVDGKLKLVLDLPDDALQELGILLQARQPKLSSPVPVAIEDAPSYQAPSLPMEELEPAAVQQEAITAQATSEQLSQSINTLDDRITNFRENLERIRARSTPSPTESTIQGIQKRYLERILEGIAPVTETSNTETPLFSTSTFSVDSIAPEVEGEMAANETIDTLISQVESFKLTRNKPEGGEIEDVQVSETGTIDELDPEMLTETLAFIHLQQGKKDEAVRLYEKLQLKFPEKSSYFAARISDILQS
jgi:hypothetical protein